MCYEQFDGTMPIDRIPGRMCSRDEAQSFCGAGKEKAG